MTWLNKGVTCFVSSEPREGFQAIHEIKIPEYNYRTESEGQVHESFLSGEVFYVKKSPANGYQVLHRMVKGHDHLLCLNYQVPMYANRGYLPNGILGFAPMIPSNQEDIENLVPLYMIYNTKTKDYRHTLEKQSTESCENNIYTDTDGWYDEAMACIEHKTCFNLILRGDDAKKFKVAYSTFDLPVAKIAGVDDAIVITAIIVIGIIALAGIITIGIVFMRAVKNGCFGDGESSTEVGFPSKNEVKIKFDCRKG